jgi:predicted double-glycine peptidase
LDEYRCGPWDVHGCGHYSVVCGLDKRHILLEDPGIGRRRRLSRRNFLNVWFDFKRVFPKAQDDLIIRRLIVVAPQEFSPRRRTQIGSRKSAPFPCCRTRDRRE